MNSLAALLVLGRILIPINYSGPGAFGADWLTQVLVENLSGSDLRQPGASFRVICSADEGCVSDTIATGSIGYLDTPAPGGFILDHVNSGDSDGVFASVRIATGARSVLTGGTSIPIARDSDFRSEIVLPLVPSASFDRPVRAMIRIYSLDAPDGAVARVSFRSHTFEAPFPFPDVPVRLSRPLGSPLFPAYAAADLFAVLQGRGAFGSLRVKAPEGSRIWVLVTLTDNVTNEVTAITPH